MGGLDQASGQARKRKGRGKRTDRCVVGRMTCRRVFRLGSCRWRSNRLVLSSRRGGAGLRQRRGGALVGMSVCELQFIT